MNKVYRNAQNEIRKIAKHLTAKLRKTHRKRKTFLYKNAQNKKPNSVKEFGVLFLMVKV